MGVPTTFIMSKSMLVFVLVTGLTSIVLGMGYTSNSGCASICSDSSTVNSSSVQGSDIVCTVGEYRNSSVGQKFEKCINCLQNSSTSTPIENDIMWFICEFGSSQQLMPSSHWTYRQPQICIQYLRVCNSKCFDTFGHFLFNRDRVWTSRGSSTE